MNVCLGHCFFFSFIHMHFTKIISCNNNIVFHTFISHLEALVFICRALFKSKVHCNCITQMICCGIQFVLHTEHLLYHKVCGRKHALNSIRMFTIKHNKCYNSVLWKDVKVGHGLSDSYSGGARLVHCWLKKMNIVIPVPPDLSMYTRVEHVKFILGF